jgi:hypothetical protein
MSVGAESVETSYELLREPPLDEIVIVPIAAANVVHNYRDGRNPKQDELDKSIKDKEIIYAPCVARFDRQQTEEYVAFSNETWGGVVSIDDFVPEKPGGDTFLIVVDGHSRLLSAYKIAEELGVDPMQYGEKFKVDDKIVTIDDLLARQTEANIQSEPPKQNLARTLAELWLWMQRPGNEKNRLTKKQFVAHHNVGEQALRDALGYVELPTYIRDLTEKSTLHYSKVIELSRSLPTLREYCAVKCAEKGDSDKMFEYELLKLTYDSIGRPILAARKATKDSVARMAEEVRAANELGEPEVEGPQDAMDFGDFMQLVKEESPEEISLRELQEMTARGGKLIKSSTVDLHNRLTILAGAEENVVDLETYQALESETYRLVGKKAIAA